ncbi:MAG TPA: PEP-CTERM sorting domain-containing protein [Verrucomicrobiae bacterium]|nr:PEP-CTERM sorting domain-containing protein [Verrucomicrobiae bacterium]
MKKSILLGIVALGAAAATSYGQGYITLDNYASAGTLVTYGDALTPANGVSGAMGGIGSPLSSAWTVGLYFVGGTSGLVQAAGSDMPDASLALGTGLGSTAQVAGSSVFGNPGYFNSPTAFNSGSTLNTTITLEVVVYDTAGGSYANAQYRGHSHAFAMPTVGATSGSPSFTGANGMGGIEVFQVIPEPTTMALGGLGLAALMLVRRKKA